MEMQDKLGLEKPLGETCKTEEEEDEKVEKKKEEEE